MSQLDLSLDAGISQRHISFIESGRSVPGRETLLVLMQVLDIPLRERNAVLLSAGYAPLYSEAAWNAQEMSSIQRALERILQKHEPYPAVVMDRHWNVLISNDAAPRFFNLFVDLQARSQPRNMLHLLFDPEGMRPHVAEWEKVASSLIHRVRREAIGHVLDQQSRELLDALLAYPGVRPEWTKEAGDGPASALPMIPMGFIHGAAVLNYFSMVTTVGAPQSVAAQELRIECMFPADEATERWHLILFEKSALQGDTAPTERVRPAGPA